MTHVKAVIGANFGDEGKGLMTDYFCEQARVKKEKCLVVCTNGGAQRGHTVTTPDGMHHVFSHFGSGIFAGAHTWLPHTYILNPVIFRKEYEELEDMGYEPKVLVNENCLWSTPYDMIINQIIEDSRGAARHGSCGVGIWETIVRNRQDNLPRLTMIEFNQLAEEEKINYLENVKKYFKKRLKDNGIEEIPDKWRKILESVNLMYNFIDDAAFLAEHVVFVSANDLVRKDCSVIDDSSMTDILSYETIIFENGQGLLLDQNRPGCKDHTTPSNTGIRNIQEILQQICKNYQMEYDLEVCYVTRTYLTRHGNGDLPTECKKEEINPEIVDLTNVPNPYQGTLRYGKINLQELEKRIFQDAEFKKEKKCTQIKVSLAVTHLNETDSQFICEKECDKNKDNKDAVKNFTGKFHNLYLSDSNDRTSVVKIIQKQ